jgi:spore coat polysaccharide biosynthesis protein SpsF (cytidylyltransferase family)
MNTVAIIQVRLGSTRLPRKALLPIGDYPSELLKADVIVRVTGDCIFTDPDTIAAVLETYLVENKSYSENEPAELAYHGLECQVFDFFILREAYYKATSAFDREHVIPWMRRKYGYECTTSDNEIPRAKVRAVLDTVEDYEFFRQVANVMSTEPPNPTVEQLLQAWEHNLIPKVTNEV